MVDLRTVVAVHCRRSVVQCRHQVGLNIPYFRGVIVDTAKDILHMAGIDF